MGTDRLSRLRTAIASRIRRRLGVTRLDDSLAGARGRPRSGDRACLGAARRPRGADRAERAAGEDDDGDGLDRAGDRGGRAARLGGRRHPRPGGGPPAGDRVGARQSYPNWELLVCDDGSADETAAAVAAVRGPEGAPPAGRAGRRRRRAQPGHRRGRRGADRLPRRRQPHAPELAQVGRLGVRAAARRRVALRRDRDRRHRPPPRRARSRDAERLARAIRPDDDRRQQHRRHLRDRPSGTARARLAGTRS